MRMSPKRVSPWLKVGVPNGWPPSDTSPTLRSAREAQAWTASRIVCCQDAVGCVASSVLNRSLDWPPIAVPSGAKLTVRCVAIGHDWP